MPLSFLFLWRRFASHPAVKWIVGALAIFAFVKLKEKRDERRGAERRDAIALQKDTAHAATINERAADIVASYDDDPDAARERMRQRGLHRDSAEP